MADDGDGFAGLDPKADVVQHPVFVFVREPDVVEFDGGGCARNRPGLGWRLNVRRCVEQFEDTLGGGHGRLQDVVLVAQVLNRAEESQSILEESNQHAQRDRAAADAKSSVSEQQRERQHPEKFHPRDKTSRRR